MDNQFIIKISIVIAVVGVLGLYFFTSMPQKISDIREMPEYLGERITVRGNVEKYYVSKDGHVFFDIRDDSGIAKSVVFRNSNIEAAYTMKEGDKITVVGKVQEYKNDLEIIVSKIDV